jgi:predicted nicotinamide N-methyase
LTTLRYRFQTREFGEHDIHYRALRNRQEYDDSNGAAEALGISPASWPLFGVVWQSGEVLAKLMADYKIDGLRILEVGCGVGLASLVLNKRLADISATDIHPSAKTNLRYNTDLNNNRSIPFLRTAWEDQCDEGFGLFDLLICSDVLFEPDHAVKLAAFLELYARPKSEVILVDAGRGLNPKFTQCMAANDYSCERLDDIEPFTKPETFKGKIQRYRRG